MATVSVSLTQAAHDTTKALREQNGVSGLSDTVDVFFKFSHLFSTTHTEYTSGSLIGSNLRLNYDDGGYSNFLGVIDDTPTQSSGTGSATSLEQYAPQLYRLTYGGNIKMKYTAGQNGTNFESAGGLMNAAAIQLLLPTYHSGYNSTLGNVTISLQGAVNISPAGEFSGKLTSFTQRADKFISSGTIAGNFDVAGNTVSIGLNLATTSLSGTLNSVTQRYHDGSVWNINDAAIRVAGSSILSEAMLGNALNFPDSDTFNISLPASVSTTWLIASGAGDDSVTLSGGGSALAVNAGTGNDQIFLKDHQHAVDGGSGRDTVVFDGMRSAYTVSKIGTTFVVKVADSSSVSDQLSNVERLVFGDVNLALDVNGVAGQAYRIYQAAFNRTPDNGGIGFWIRAMDDGFSLPMVAQEFVRSNEFKILFGLNPSNRDIVSKFYQNVLQRQGEAGGIDFWTGVLDQGLASLADVLVGFSESPENQSAVATLIGNGFTYTPFG